MSSDLVVDLTNLREFSQERRDFEKFLFDEFIRSSTELIKVLQPLALKNGGCKEWCDNAHALKGISYNLGAMTLGEMSRTAEGVTSETADYKKDLLDSIMREHQQVLAFLDAEMTSWNVD